MAWKVMEYMDENPGATPTEILKHFAEEMEVDLFLESMRLEVERVLEIREQLRPLYGKKMELEVEMANLNSEFEMEVMVKYPPKKGSDKQRKAYKEELQKDSPAYQALQTELTAVKPEIEELEERRGDIEQEAKNARRLVETFNIYASYILSHAKQGEVAGEKEQLYKDLQPADNRNAF